MKHLKTIGLSLCLAVTISAAHAQKVTITKGSSQVPNKRVNGSEEFSFVSNDINYFFTSYTDRGLRTFYLQSFDKNGTSLVNNALSVDVGVFNNSYSIDEIAGFSNKVYALVEHLDKPAGKNSLLAREVDSQGNVAKSETELMSFPFEKTMNSGFNYSSVSPDGNTLAVVGELPYNKEMPAQFKIALYNKDLKKIKEGDIKFPGENTKNKSITVKVANDGTVYLIRKGMTKKGEITLAAYQWQSETPSEVKEYIIELTPPNQIFNYSYAISKNDELIISGLSYERKTLTVGETKAIGGFYFINKGKKETVFKTFNLDAPVDNLTARKIMTNGSTVFLIAEQYKEQRITPPASAAGSMSNFDFNYDYTHKSEFVIALDNEGTKKFQLEVAKDFMARDYDKQYYAAYYICNDKLTIIYNDQTRKHVKGYESYYSGEIPVLVQITNDGLMQSPVVFKDDLKIEQYCTLYPSMSNQVASNKIALLMKNGTNTKLITFTID